MQTYSMHHNRNALIALLVGFALLAAACGGSSEAGTESAATTATPADEDSQPDETTAPQTTAVNATTSTAAPSTTAAPTTTTPPSLNPDLELIGPGPYGVGVATITIDDETDRPLTVDVWFPLADDVTGDPQQYTLLPGTYYESPDAVVATAADLSADGPFPLVIYSHGSGGLRYIHSNYTEAIASHGYVVAAPDHTGNTSLELIAGNPDEPEVIAFNRPNDVGNLIDALLDPASPAGAFTSSIDGESIAVTGHSFGGYTAFAMAVGHDNPAGNIERDLRVDAIIPLAPATGPQLLSDDRLASIAVPSMVIVGTDDATTPVDPNVTRPWDLNRATPSYRVELIAAEHQTFTDVCDYQTFLPTLEAVPEVISSTIDDFAEAGCQPDDLPIERAQELTNTFAIRFLDEIFKGAEPLSSSNLVVDDTTVFTSAS